MCEKEIALNMFIIADASAPGVSGASGSAPTGTQKRVSSRRSHEVITDLVMDLRSVSAPASPAQQGWESLQVHGVLEARIGRSAPHQLHWRFMSMTHPSCQLGWRQFIIDGASTCSLHSAKKAASLATRPFQ